MHISARILRNDASQMDRGAATLTARDVAQRDRIAAVGMGLMARHGSHSISMAAFAAALGHCVPTIRRHFADMDALLAYLLRRHLQFLAECLGAVPFEPDRPAALRAAYLAATRSVMGGLTEAHMLLVRDRGLLPQDERDPVEDTLQGLACVLAGELGPQILYLLDSPMFNAIQIECMLQTLSAPAGRPAEEAVPATATSGLKPGSAVCPPPQGLSQEAERALVDGLFRDREPPPRPVLLPSPPDGHGWHDDRAGEAGHATPKASPDRPSCSTGLSTSPSSSPGTGLNPGPGPRPRTPSRPAARVARRKSPFSSSG